ncbi:MAG TPA: methyltransferase [Ramlibacter sp.]|nr:methyltransferase [Ramlibacter sp.]
MEPCTTDQHHASVRAMLDGHWMTQAICAAAALGVPALLAARPRDAQWLARETATDANSLVRLLRYLVSLGLVATRADGCFELTPMGSLLDPAARDSLHPWALLRSARWAEREELESSVRTGRPWRSVAGADNFSELPEDPRAAAVFHQAMVAVTRRVAMQVLQVIDFGATETVVDVGGGSGEFAIALLNAHPMMQGIVFDLEHAREGALLQFNKASVAERCRFAAGSFFDAVPPKADTYLLKSVLHNWDDERAACILARCRAALSGSARLLIVERILPRQWTASAAHQSAAASDLRMLVGLSGRERSESEFRALLAAGRLRLNRVIPTAGEFQVIEAVAN